MQLSAKAKTELYAMVAATAALYGVSVGETYSATPTIAQTIFDTIMEQGNPFLKKINVIPVTDVSGDKVGMGISGLIASRTDTSGDGERNPINPLQSGSHPYYLNKVDSDIGIPYALIDMWSKFPDFRTRYNNYVKNAIANDLLRVGWNGISAAATTNKTAHPNGEDVNVGWLEQIRTYNGGSQHLIGTTGVPVVLGSNDFPTLDSLVFDAIGRLPVWYQDDPSLVALISKDLLNYEKTRLYGKVLTPFQKEVVDNEKVEYYGGIPFERPPFLPASGILVTPLANLSIYYQDTSWRRTQFDNAKKDRYEDFNSRNEGYVVEDFNATSFIEHVTLA